MAGKKENKKTVKINDGDGAANARKKQMILQAAIRLFLENGYADTSLRQIAEASDTSASLIIYHYGTKQAIAIEYLSEKLKVIREAVKTKIDMRVEPELFCCTLVRLNQMVMATDTFCRFYHEVIEEGIFRAFFFDFDNEINVSDLILAKRQFKLTPELYPFYSHYIIPSVELASWLSSGTAAPMDEKIDIPFQTLMGLLNVPPDEVAGYCQRGKKIAQEIIDECPSFLRM